jgi:hypothetical protein
VTETSHGNALVGDAPYPVGKSGFVRLGQQSAILPILAILAAILILVERQVAARLGLT